MTDEDKQKILRSGTSGLVIWLVRAVAYAERKDISEKERASYREKIGFVRAELDRRVPIPPFDAADEEDYDRSLGT